MAHGLRPKVIEYQEAFDRFVEERKIINNSLEKGNVQQAFENLKSKAMQNDAVAMDVIAYYYKSGITNFLKEDYKKYLYWELLACSKGNNFAIDKMQFLFNNAYDTILDDEDFDRIAYLNDLKEDTFLYFLGKEIAKTMVKKYKINAENLLETKDEYNPFKNELLIEFKKDLDSEIPIVIEKLK